MELAPISKVPYEILREIFVYCLPRYRLANRQPDIKLAPMLLCHICSSWRIIALAFPTLWSHLYFRLVPDYVDERPHDGFAGNWIVYEKEYAFLMWWRDNQGSMAPSLRFDLVRYEGEGEEPDHPLGPDEMTSLTEYISSARHFESNPMYWCVLWDRLGAEYSTAYPNPHTLVWHGNDVSLGTIQGFQEKLVQDPSFSPLRRLCIHRERSVGMMSKAMPEYWSALTHISLADVAVSIHYWFAVLRTLPGLEWVDLDIRIISPIVYRRPTHCVHPCLSTFWVTVRKMGYQAAENFSLSVLFMELSLPNLQNLSLSYDKKPWNDHRAISDVYNILRSTPAITTLTLSNSFLSLCYDEYFTQILPEIKDVDPIWSYSAGLLNLRLGVLQADTRNKDKMREAWDTLVRNILSFENSWLDIGNPACPIQRITLWMLDSLELKDEVKDFPRRIGQNDVDTDANSRIIFELVSEEENQAVMEMWNE